MSQDLKAGDFLVFQLEAGYALLRLLGTDENDGNKVWHLAAYSDLFPDVDTAEIATAAPDRLSMSHAHIALTDRAFESTQTARIANTALTDAEIAPVTAWRQEDEQIVSDRSVRLMLGLR